MPPRRFYPSRNHDRGGYHRAFALLALPSLARARRRSQNARFVNDLRVLTAAFELYNAEHSAYPPNTTPGFLPPKMATYLSPTLNFATTPIGGSWDWVNRKTDSHVGVSVVAPFADSAQLAQIDALVDDGNLATGNFIQSSPDHYVAIIE